MGENSGIKIPIGNCAIILSFNLSNKLLQFVTEGLFVPEKSPRIFLKENTQ